MSGPVAGSRSVTSRILLLLAGGWIVTCVGCIDIFFPVLVQEPFGDKLTAEEMRQFAGDWLLTDDSNDDEPGTLRYEIQDDRIIDTRQQTGKETLPELTVVRRVGRQLLIFMGEAVSEVEPKAGARPGYCLMLCEFDSPEKIRWHWPQSKPFEELVASGKLQGTVTRHGKEGDDLEVMITSPVADAQKVLTEEFLKSAIDRKMYLVHTRPKEEQK